MRIAGLDSGPFFAVAAAAAAATTEVVAAQTGKKIRVLSYSVSGLLGGAAGSAQFKSAATAISNTLLTSITVTLAESHPLGLFETVAGEALNVTMVTALATSSVRVTYALIGS